MAEVIVIVISPFPLGCSCANSEDHMYRNVDSGKVTDETKSSMYITFQ